MVSAGSSESSVGLAGVGVGDDSTAFEGSTMIEAGVVALVCRGLRPKYREGSARHFEQGAQGQPPVMWR